MIRLYQDADIAHLLGISLRTFRRRLENPVKGEIDLNEAQPQVICGRRFWWANRVDTLIKSHFEQLEKTITRS